MFYNPSIIQHIHYIVYVDISCTKTIELDIKSNIIARKPNDTWTLSELYRPVKLLILN